MVFGARTLRRADDQPQVFSSERRHVIQVNGREGKEPGRPAGEMTGPRHANSSLTYVLRTRRAQSGHALSHLPTLCAVASGSHRVTVTTTTRIRARVHSKMMRLAILLAALLVAKRAIAAPVEFQAAPGAVSLLRSFAVNSSSSASLPPSEDPFYHFPDDLDTYGNGTIIRSRPVNTSFAAVANSSYQLFYRTTSAVGNASAALTTVFSPRAPVSPPQIMLLMGKRTRHRRVWISSDAHVHSTDRLGVPGLPSWLRARKRYWQ